MPPVDDDFTILVCDCGKRLKARGARPGRVGQCPACGGILRAPGEAAAPPTARAPEDASERRAADAPRKTRKPAAPLPMNAAPDAEASRPVNPTRVAVGTAAKRTPVEPIGREGLVRAPKRPEDGLFANLAYPLWDGNGLAMLFFLPPTLWLTSLLSIGLIPNYVVGADEVTMLGALTMIAPMTVFLLLTLGYVGIFLGDMVATSAFGEVYHPRMPPWQTGPVLASLLRGVWSLAAGLLVSGPLIYLYLSGRPSIGAREWLSVALLAVPGVAYAPVALVAVLLQGSLAAANPITVLAALLRSGADSLRLAFLTGLSASAAALAVVGLFWIGSKYGMLAVLVGSGAFWFGFLYGAMVLARLLGLFYRRHAEAIGWFPDRPRWGVGA